MPIIGLDRHQYEWNKTVNGYRTTYHRRKHTGAIEQLTYDIRVLVDIQQYITNTKR